MTADIRPGCLIGTNTFANIGPLVIVISITCKACGTHLTQVEVVEGALAAIRTKQTNVRFSVRCSTTRFYAPPGHNWVTAESSIIKPPGRLLKFTH